MGLLFDKHIGLIDHKNLSVTKRIAVRAIIETGGKLLLLESNRGDCKLPGGGVDKGESYETALIREIAEETGYINAKVVKKVGRVLERKIDSLDSNAIFEMESHYYLCDVGACQEAQNLDAYEEALDFTTSWMTIDEALHINEKFIKSNGDSGWAKRENMVFSELRSYIEEESFK